MNERADIGVDPAVLAPVVAWTAVLGGVLTAVTTVAPHANRTYDAANVALGALLLVVGVGYLLVGRRRRVSRLAVHALVALLSAIALALTWLGMVDLAGIQAILLVIMLGMAVMLGPTRWSVSLAVLQSVGFALVLATSERLTAVDAVSQWEVVTAGLVVALVFNQRLRAQLRRSHVHELRRSEERIAEREQHAERLERLNEELREAGELKSRFVAMASHELRTPLTSIEGFSATMLHRWAELDDDDKHAFVSIIEAQSMRLGRLVTDLLTISRIESGRLRPRTEPVAVAGLVARVVEAVAFDGTVHVRVPASLRVLADPDHVQQVLINLLSNAVAYGAAPMSVEAHEDDDDDGPFVRIEVVDAGPGVPESFVPRLFERFARADDVRSHDSSPGTGLGLSIAMGLAEANGGTIGFTPGDPAGSRFWLRVPRATS